MTTVAARYPEYIWPPYPPRPPSWWAGRWLHWWCVVMGVGAAILVVALACLLARVWVDEPPTTNVSGDTTSAVGGAK